MKTLICATLTFLSVQSYALEGFYKLVGTSYNGLLQDHRFGGRIAKGQIYFKITDSLVESIHIRDQGKYYEVTREHYYTTKIGDETYLTFLEDKKDPCYEKQDTDIAPVMRVLYDPSGVRILLNAMGSHKDGTLYSIESSSVLMAISEEQYLSVIDSTDSLQQACLDANGNLRFKLPSILK